MSENKKQERRDHIKDFLNDFEGKSPFPVGHRNQYEWWLDAINKYSRLVHFDEKAKQEKEKCMKCGNNSPTHCFYCFDEWDGVCLSHAPEERIHCDTCLDEQIKEAVVGVLNKLKGKFVTVELVNTSANSKILFKEDFDFVLAEHKKEVKK